MNSTLQTIPSPTYVPDRNPPVNNSSNLYLVTFLATLFLLLFITCSIVIRSYILRRRFQRNIAMRADIILAPHPSGSRRRRRLGARPKLFDAWLAPGGETWSKIMPLSLLPIQVKCRPRSLASKASNIRVVAALPVPPASPPHALLRCLRSLMHCEPQDTAAGRAGFGDLEHVTDKVDEQTREGVAGKDAAKEKEKEKRKVDMLQVSVLIAMPTPAKRWEDSGRKCGEDQEGEIPEVVLGVVRLPSKTTP